MVEKHFWNGRRPHTFLCGTSQLHWPKVSLIFESYRIHADHSCCSLAWEELYLSVNEIFQGAKLTLENSMTEEDMKMEDRFNIAPKSRKLWLRVVPI